MVFWIFDNSYWFHLLLIASWYNVILYKDYSFEQTGSFLTVIVSLDRECSAAGDRVTCLKTGPGDTGAAAAAAVCEQGCVFEQVCCVFDRVTSG